MSMRPSVDRALSLPRAGARIAVAALALWLAGCASPPPQRPVAPAPGPSASAAWPTPRAAAPAPLVGAGVRLQAASWGDLPGWAQDDFSGVWQALRRDCSATLPPAMVAVCARAAAVPADDVAAQRAFFQTEFQPWRVLPAGGSADSGLITGYYEPVLHGSLTRAWPYVVPVWGLPDDLQPLPAPGPDGVSAQRVAWRDGQRVTAPYWSRAQIQSDPAAQAQLDRNVVVWLDDPVDALFLQVQGSGLVRLPDGRLLRLSYAGNNGWPYQSVGRWLLDTGRVQGTVTMQVIRAWAQLHPDEVPQLLAANPRVVFFRAEPAADPQRGPVGALGVPLTAMRSVAVDKSMLRLGLPLWLSTTLPPPDQPATPSNGVAWNALVFAQDVGSAITGAIRADVFTGTGDAAGALAGRMQSPGRIWVLLPAGG
jgi:membrane-bound lytic murein transglycosylase A